MLIVPPVSFGAVAFGRYIRKIAKRTTDANADLVKMAEEKMSNLKTVRSFSKENFEISNFIEKSKMVFDFGMKDAFSSGLFFGLVEII
jgi:ABC-type multidrug transport system fused ATPase/permease subunit